MKRFAITPEYLTFDDLGRAIASLKTQSVSFLYIRSPLLQHTSTGLVTAISSAGILPLMPCRGAAGLPGTSFGIHFKSSELDMLAAKQYAPGTTITASCHDFACAVQMLQGRADYVFVSPVFKPRSKQEDTRELFPRDRLRELVNAFGERVVLLGGLTGGRIKELQEELQHDFSIAGITMFFRKEQ